MKLSTARGFVAVIVVMVLVGIAGGIIRRHGFARRSNFSVCLKCGRTWDVAPEHCTPYEWSDPGTVPLLLRAAANTNSLASLPPELVQAMAKRDWTISCFPLCESCWVGLQTPSARLPYYRALMDKWKAFEHDQYNSETNWPAIRASVMAGL